MHDDFSWLSMLWLLVLMLVLFGIPALTFWWDGRASRRRAAEAARERSRGGP